MDHPRKTELIALLGNCVLALALGNDPRVLQKARQAADRHVRELDRKFPGWKQDLQS